MGEGLLYQDQLINFFDHSINIYKIQKRKKEYLHDNNKQFVRNNITKLLWKQYNIYKLLWEQYNIYKLLWGVYMEKIKFQPT